MVHSLSMAVFHSDFLKILSSEQLEGQDSSNNLTVGLDLSTLVLAESHFVEKYVSEVNTIHMRSQNGIREATLKIYS